MVLSGTTFSVVALSIRFKGWAVGTLLLADTRRLGI